MNVLGINFGSGAHDTSAAILCDGRLVVAAEQERFSRKKHDSDFPLEAIEFCLSSSGLGMADIDFLAFPLKPFRSGPDAYMAEIDPGFLYRNQRLRRASWRNLAHYAMVKPLLACGWKWNFGMESSVAEAIAGLAARYGPLPPLSYFDHHQAHAAAAYFTSGWDSPTIITIDGSGGPYSSAIWKRTGNAMSRLAAEPAENSLGEYYWQCTLHVGLGEFAEGKMMGLAAYGNPESGKAFASRLLNIEGKSWYSYHTRPSTSSLGFPPRTNQPLPGLPYDDFSAGVQRQLELAVQRIVKSAVAESSNRQVCMGGGVMLNCSSNGALLESGVCDDIWLFPASGDAGLSVGAAFLCCAQQGFARSVRVEHAYWGAEFSRTAIKQVLGSAAASGLLWHESDHPAVEIAACLAGGEVVGWFQGRAEIGPRALGARSILADPRNIKTRDRVNKIKSREMWRPLAPVTLQERAAEFFQPSIDSPFMLIRTWVRPEKRSVIPAAVHVDGSARPQTVNPERNLLLYRLIQAFDKLTGVPVLLNTSFNQASEPMVWSPEHALRTFLATDLDVLVLGDFVVRKPLKPGLVSVQPEKDSRSA